MDLTEFAARCDAIETRLSDRGFVTPEVKAWIRFCGSLFYIEAEAKINTSSPISDKINSSGFRGNTVEEMHEAFAALEAWVDEQKTPEERRLEDFTKNMAFLVEEGRALDLPILPDLEATMKRLSENIIEFHVA
ncbi:hypothetical protein N9Y00_07120 [Tateyamaria sp.]|nr:hypothetical protein [Tateyamaria sp.]